MSTDALYRAAREADADLAAAKERAEEAWDTYHAALYATKQPIIVSAPTR